MASPAPETSPAREADLRRDVSELRRGVAINFLGYLIKIAHPVLLVVVVRCYGAEAFGLFTVASNALLLVMRFAVLGLDKGLLWWVPRQDAVNERRSIRSVLALTGVTSTVAALLIGLLLAPWVARWSGDAAAQSALVQMSAVLVPMTLLEVLVSCSLGKKRMEAQVFVKEGVVSTTLVASATLYYFLGFTDVSGLSLGYTTAYLAGLAGAIWTFRRSFRGSQFEPGESLAVPRELWRYSVPLWMSEILNSFVLRMDVIVTASLTDARTMGIYSAVMQVGNSVRAVRRSFDAIVLATMSQIGARRDVQRLTAAFSYATFLIIATQTPIYVFLVAFAEPLMGLFGPGFEQGAAAVLIICGFWIINGAVGLNGLIVMGYGRSDLSFYNVIITITVQFVLLITLVPWLGLEGAAVAVGGAATAQNIVNAFQARHIVGAWSYNRDVLVALRTGLGSSAVLAVVWLLLAPMGDMLARTGAFIAFALVYVGWLGWLWKSGRLPGQAAQA